MGIYGALTAGRLAPRKPSDTLGHVAARYRAEGDETVTEVFLSFITTVTEVKL